LTLRMTVAAAGAESASAMFRLCCRRPFYRPGKIKLGQSLPLGSIKRHTLPGFGSSHMPTHGVPGFMCLRNPGTGVMNCSSWARHRTSLIVPRFVFSAREAVDRRRRRRRQYPPVACSVNGHQKT
jgi:hypothetical protein